MPTWARRIIVRTLIRRRGHPTLVHRFSADRWHTFRIYCAGAQMTFQQVDSIPYVYVRQPQLLIVRAAVEGVEYWKVDSAAPTIATAPGRISRLRPCEITDEFTWSQASKPAIVIRNRTARPVQVEVIYATREEEMSPETPIDL